MKKEYDYDVVVLGGGSAGIAAAVSACDAGASVCIVEERKLGGECAFSACTPTKALLHVARLYHAIRSESAQLGITVRDAHIDMRKVQERKRALLRSLYNDGKNVRTFLEKKGISVVEGRGRFFDDHTIIVGATKKISARAFVLAVGATDAPVSFPCSPDVPILRYRDALEQTKLPSSVIIVGGGPIGCEFATLWSLLGVRVTLLQHDAQLLARDEQDLAVLVETGLRKRGVHVVCNATILEAKKQRGSVTVSYQEKDASRVVVRAEQLFVATGRIPYVEGLHLELVKKKDHLFFAGDVSGGMQFTSVAAAEGNIAGWNAAHAGKKRVQKTFASEIIPRVTFTFPELASVGLTLRDAQKIDAHASVHAVPLRALSRAAIDGRREGMLKVVLARDSETILGAHLLGEHAGEVIHEYALAMQAQVPWSTLRSVLRAYPTYSEIAGM